MKKSSFFIQLRNVLLLLLVVGSLVVGVNLIYRLLFQPVFKTAEETITSLPVTTDFPVEAFKTEELYHLSEDNISDYANQAEGTPWSEDNPPAPTDVSVINPQTGEELIIFWKKPPGPADFVRLYRGGELIADNLPLAGSFSDTNLINNQVYYYFLRSVKQINGEDFVSQNITQVSAIPTDITPPLSPTELKISATGQKGELQLTWKNPTVEDFALVRLYRSTQKGELGNLIKETAAEEYLDKNLIDGQIYYYTLTAVDTSGNESSKTLTSNVIGNPSPFKNL